jgi:hypothetical protein
MGCRDCSHPGDAHVNGECVVCGCVKFVGRDPKARETRHRIWVAKVEFFVKNRWISKEVRVRAMGHVGAAMKAVKEASNLPSSLALGSPNCGSLSRPFRGSAAVTDRVFAATLFQDESLRCGELCTVVPCSVVDIQLSSD